MAGKGKEIRMPASFIYRKTPFLLFVLGNVNACHVHGRQALPRSGRNAIDRLLSQTEVVVCRTGYSSLMDLKSAGKKALLIPTPGQPEQAYLGRHLHNDPHYIVQEQGKIDIHHALCQLSDRQSPEPVQQNSELLHDAMMDFFALAETHDQD